MHSVEDGETTAVANGYKPTPEATAAVTAAPLPAELDDRKSLNESFYLERNTSNKKTEEGSPRARAFVDKDPLLG